MEELKLHIKLLEFPHKIWATHFSVALLFVCFSEPVVSRMLEAYPNLGLPILLYTVMLPHVKGLKSVSGVTESVQSLCCRRLLRSGGLPMSNPMTNVTAVC